MKFFGILKGAAQKALQRNRTVLLSHDRITFGQLTSQRQFVSLNKYGNLALHWIAVGADRYFTSSFSFPTNVSNSLRVRIQQMDFTCSLFRMNWLGPIPSSRVLNLGLQVVSRARHTELTSDFRKVANLMVQVIGSFRQRR